MWHPHHFDELNLTETEISDLTCDCVWLAIPVQDTPLHGQSHTFCVKSHNFDGYFTKGSNVKWEGQPYIIPI